MSPSSRKETPTRLRIKRIYEPAAKDDGRRILVDGIWPRGFSKERAHVDEWLKEIAPSSNLRKWFGHDPDRWSEFRKRYRAELRANEPLVDRLVERAQQGSVTLIFSAKDEERNQAFVLCEVLRERLESRD